MYIQYISSGLILSYKVICINYTLRLVACHVFAKPIFVVVIDVQFIVFEVQVWFQSLNVVFCKVIL